MNVSQKVNESEWILLKYNVFRRNSSREYIIKIKEKKYGKFATNTELEYLIRLQYYRFETVGIQKSYPSYLILSDIFVADLQNSFWAGISYIEMHLRKPSTFNKPLTIYAV